MNKNKWNLKSEYTLTSPEVIALAEAVKIPPVIALLLLLRGCDTPEKANAFIQLSESKLHDPFLIPDMEKAVFRLEAAIAKKEKVIIYGDYDVDGVTSVSVLSLYLQKRGLSVSYYIPDRSGEGYGINNFAIDKFASDGVSLMITVDTGVTAERSGICAHAWDRYHCDRPPRMSVPPSRCGGGGESPTCRQQISF